MWENLTLEMMNEYFWDTPLQARHIGYIMETVNVVIDESSDSGFEKLVRNFLKKFFLLSQRKFKKLLNKSPHLQVLLVLLVICLCASRIGLG